MLVAFLRWFRVTIVAIGVAAVLGGCAFFPTQGPNPEFVTGEAPGGFDRLPYLVVDLTPNVVSIVQRQPLRTLGSQFRDRSGPANLRLGPGDIVAVTIFEAAAGGLFIPTEAGSRPGNFITLPSQEISRAGTISVPFAGEIQAANRTPQDVQATIEQRLRNRAIEPQAVVSLVEARSSLVSVTGEVTQPARFAISRAGDRLLDAITRAGGSRWPPHETYVMLQRGGRTASVYFNRLVRQPDNNIYLRPGDTIIVRREARTFMALGASGQNGQINFDQEELTLSEGIGRAGAILDSRGDPAQTFVYRLEDRVVLERLGHDVRHFNGDMIPVVYRINLREPQGFFLATKFPMQPKDILFVSNAPTVELAKVLNIIQLAANTVTDSDAARISLRAGRR